MPPVFGPGPISTTFCVHPYATFLQRVLHQFLSDLRRAGLTLQLTPTHAINFLGFRVNTLANTIAHLPSRIADTVQLLDKLTPLLPLTYLRRAAGLQAFYLSLYGTGFSVLGPLYTTIHTRAPFSPNKCGGFFLMNSPCGGVHRLVKCSLMRALPDSPL